MSANPSTAVPETDVPERKQSNSVEAVPPPLPSTEPKGQQEQRQPSPQQQQQARRSVEPQSSPSQQAQQHSQQQQGKQWSEEELKCCVLVLPLTNKVTPNVILKNFVKYGNLLEVRTVKGSSSCIARFSKSSEAAKCIYLFQNHSKIRVTPVDRQDYLFASSPSHEVSKPSQNSSQSNPSSQGSHSTSLSASNASKSASPPQQQHSQQPQQQHASSISKNLSKLQSLAMGLDSHHASPSREDILDRERYFLMQQHRMQLLYKQRQCYQLLIENDKIECRKRDKQNELMFDRILSMGATSSELNDYLKHCIGSETDYETKLHKFITTTARNVEAKYATTRRQRARGQLAHLAQVDGKDGKKTHFGGHQSRMGTFGMGENGGTVHSAGIAIDSLHKNRFEQYNEMRSRVFDNVLQQAKKYSNNVGKACDGFHARFSEMNSKMHETKRDMEDEWNGYETVLNDTLRAQSELIDRVSNMDGKDANVNENGMGSNRLVSNGVGQHQQQQQQLQQQQLQQKAQQTRKVRVDVSTNKYLINPSNDPFLYGKSFDCKQRKYKESLVEYNSEMEKLVVEMVRNDKRRIDDLKDILVGYFIAQKAIAMNQLKLIEASIEYVKGIDKEKDVKDWISRYGLYVTNDVNEMENDANGVENNKNNNKNINKNVNNNQNEQNKNANDFTNELYNLQGRESSFHIHSKNLSNMVYEDVIRWGALCRPGAIIRSNWKPIWAVISRFGHFHTFNTKDDWKPLLSVPLWNVTVEMVENDEERKLYTFEISVPNQSWISLTGAPTKYLFKAETFEECVDWVVELKKFSNMR